MKPAPAHNVTKTNVAFVLLTLAGWGFLIYLMIEELCK